MLFADIKWQKPADIVRTQFSLRRALFYAPDHQIWIITEVTQEWLEDPQRRFGMKKTDGPFVHSRLTALELMCYIHEMGLHQDGVRDFR